MKLISVLSVVLLVFFSVAPVSAGPPDLVTIGLQLETLRAEAAAEPSITYAIQTGPAPTILRTQAVASGGTIPDFSGAFAAMVNSAIMTKIMLVQVRAIDDMARQMLTSNQPPPEPARRSVFGLTATGGALGCAQGAFAGGLAEHLAWLGGPITGGTALILGCIAGQ